MLGATLTVTSACLVETFVGTVEAKQHERRACERCESRPRLGRALVDLAAGDTLVVWRLDRLGWSLRDLLDISELLR